MAVALASWGHLQGQLQLATLLQPLHPALPVQSQPDLQHWQSTSLDLAAPPLGGAEGKPLCIDLKVQMRLLSQTTHCSWCLSACGNILLSQPDLYLHLCRSMCLQVIMQARKTVCFAAAVQQKELQSPDMH